MARVSDIILLSVLFFFLNFTPSHALSINWHDRKHHASSSSISTRNLIDSTLSILKRFPRLIYSSKTSISTSTRLSLSIGSKKATTTVQEPSKYSGSPTLGNTAGHVSLSQVAGLVDSTKKSTCKGKGGIVSFKAETSETENSVSSKLSCSVKSSTKSILTALTPKKCISPTIGLYYDQVLQQTIRRVYDCNIGQETLVYRDPELGKDVALYKKGDFTIRRFYESDNDYKSIAYFVGCATNGNPVELGTKSKRDQGALEKRGFFKGNTKDPIWNCALPNADTVGGPKDSFMFAPANVGECLVIIASRECLAHSSVAFFWLDD
ncbi:hypothetical protein TWF569_003978 [Orbilia oligospora]|uniref:Uncharacterized protein n=1 Tax=Orbilia oligospora TaxID=2813651 RepID=A0A7C8NPY1_ORBOL|nr:hypothetical protein TWF706_002598 [Orbilia oligospora]KAF3129933.1 hypothetical protein TWF703_008467 [Orbilia oligospora]KAF3136524.1 hypothetical protein TWF594_007798 [Orbilia oligospora]KAF3157068.1 hypothetical protein TWF569_003978 [Orbilia oligospora]